MCRVRGASEARVSLFVCTPSHPATVSVLTRIPSSVPDAQLDHLPERGRRAQARAETGGKGP